MRTERRHERSFGEVRCFSRAALTIEDIDSSEVRGETHMGFHPVNLAIRFLLELSALAAMGFWAWHQSDDPERFAFALLVPLVAAAAWGVFAVPGDRSRSGKAPVAVPGAVRLGVEAAFFAFAVFALYKAGSKSFSAILAVAASVHYVASYDRVAWLLRA